VRLFIALRFNDEVTAKLQAAVDALRSQSIRGNFTRPENLHLTLVFLGEQPDPANYIRALETLEAYCLKIQLAKTGRFKHEGGDIVFAGFQGGDELKTLYRAVCRALERAGFACGGSEYIPHVTLGREVVFKQSAGMAYVDRLLRGITIPANAVSLMCSERTGGQLVYSELYAVPLKKR